MPTKFSPEKDYPAPESATTPQKTMFPIANLLISLAHLLGFILQAYMWVIIGRAIISWVNPDPYNPIVRVLHNLTEPVLYQVRKKLPFTYTSGMDLSPLVVMLVIMFLQSFLVRTLIDIANRIG